MSEIQEQNKFPKTAPNETEIKYLPHRDFKITVIKICNEDGRATGDKQKYWRRKIPKILSEEFNSGLDQVE